MTLTSPTTAFAALPESQDRAEPVAHATADLAEPEPCQPEPEPEPAL